MSALEKPFESDLESAIHLGIQHGYYPHYFIQMLQQHGGVETARRLLADRQIQTGLMRLWELGLLHESMEAYVVQEKYRALFSEAELAEARRRLEALGYKEKGSHL
jgi:hypothetical protein